MFPSITLKIEKVRFLKNKYQTQDLDLSVGSQKLTLKKECCCLSSISKKITIDFEKFQCLKRLYLRFVIST
jgi:hypothetical protein